jgi:phospho-2-dehydro-3-deoxyheptonate aldolase
MSDRLQKWHRRQHLNSESVLPASFRLRADVNPVDAMRAASAPHAFLGVAATGLAAIVKTRGNPHTHIILRGASSGPNFAAEHVAKAKASLQKARPNHFPSIMIECVSAHVPEDPCDDLTAAARTATRRRTTGTSRKCWPTSAPSFGRASTPSLAS